MSWRKNLQKLLHRQVREIVGLCAGFALLLLAAVFISQGGLRHTNTVALFNIGNSNAAATALGDAQGVPTVTTNSTYPTQSTYTGQTYPADTTCWVNYDDISYGPNWTPLCPGQGTHGGWYSFGWTPGATDTFAVGIFSVDLGSGRGQSVYAARTFTVGDFVGSPTDDGPALYAWNNFLSMYLYSCYQYPLNYDGTPATLVGTECYTTYSTPYGLSGPTNYTAGSAVTVNAGQNMTLEWSCLPSRTVNWEEKGGTGIFSSGSWSGGTIYSYTLASSVTGSGPGFSPSGLVNTQTVTAPTTAGTYNYTLTCNGGTGAMTIPVTVNAQPPPTVTITGNGQSNSITVAPGQTVNLVATFSPAGSFIGSAIDNFDSTLALTLQDASSPKTYNFNTSGNPAAAGQSYLFNANVQTSALGWANSYGQSFTVNVSCPAGQNWNGSACVPNACANGANNYPTCTTCTAPLVWNGSSCVAQCPNGANNPPTCNICTAPLVWNGSSCVAPTCANGLNYATYGPSCTCSGGQVQSGSICVAATCPNGANNPPTCNTCTAPLVWNGSSCVAGNPTISTFSITASRVRKNTSTPVIFSWLVSNPPASNPSCTISGPSGFTTINLTQAQVNVGSWPATPITISQPSYFKLTCGSVSKQTLESVIPTVQEI